MSEPKKLSAVQHISHWTLRETEKLPSDLLRMLEADLTGRLAHDAAMAGRRFDGWPTIRLDQDDYFRSSGGWRLLAEVMTK